MTDTADVTRILSDTQAPTPSVSGTAPTPRPSIVFALRLVWILSVTVLFTHHVALVLPNAFVEWATTSCSLSASNGIIPRPACAYGLVLYQFLLPLIGSVLGTIFFWRRPTDRVRALAAFSALLHVFSAPSANLLLMNHPEITPLPTLIFNLTVVIYSTMGWVFPSGRFVPRWGMFISMAAAAWATLALVFPALSPFQTLANGGYTRSIFFLSIFAVPVIAAQVYRYRAVSTPTERQQTKWVVVGVVLGAAIHGGTFLLSHLQQKPESPLIINPNLPPATVRVLERVLAKEPKDRYPTASAFVRALQWALAL
ncbi:MAG TPA: hypothetical protein PLD47_15945 [Aggregatilineales bacterium]|nr:hypothetical protein [Anaerolineales bacterium]HRE49222.1 hypothetical protein [Aggregatilineales bacterium]